MKSVNQITKSLQKMVTALYLHAEESLTRAEGVSEQVGKLLADKRGYMAEETRARNIAEKLAKIIE